MNLPYFLQKPQEPYEPQTYRIGLDYGTTYTKGAFQRASAADVKKRAIDTIGNRVHPFRRYCRTADLGKQWAKSEISSNIQYDDHDFKIGYEISEERWYHSVLLSHLKLALSPEEAFSEDRERIEEKILSITTPLPRDERSGRGEEVGDDSDEHRHVRTPVQVLEDYFTRLFEYWKQELLEIGYDERDNLELHCAVPAAWESPEPLIQMEYAIKRASNRAALRFLEIIRFWPEPEAAAAHLLHHNPNINLLPDHVIAIVDLGGGTTDISIYNTLSRDPLEMEEIVSSGGAPCGSELLDKGFRKQCNERLAGVTSLTLEAKKDFMINAMKEFQNNIKPRFHGILPSPQGIFCGGLEHDQQKDFHKQRFLVTELVI